MTVPDNELTREVAWVACINVSPNHPEKVAEEIEEAFGLLQKLSAPADNATLCHNIALAGQLVRRLNPMKGE